MTLNPPWVSPPAAVLDHSLELGGSGGTALDPAAVQAIPVLTSQLPANVVEAAQRWAPAPSGDVTGATDTPLLAALLAAGYEIQFPANATYYINATLTLSGSNGWVMPDSTQLVWAGAAGGKVASTVPFSSIYQAAYTGRLKGGSITYPYAKITAATKVIYIAQPQPAELSTNLNTDHASWATYPPIAGSYGYALDGNSNPGPFTISASVAMQVQYQIWVGCSHVQLIGCSGAYGQHCITFDNDSLGSSIPPINCTIVGAHAYQNSGSLIHGKYFTDVTSLGGTNEPGAPTANTAVFCLIENTANGFMTLIGGECLANGRITNYSTTGLVRFINTQDSNDALSVGSAGGAITATARGLLKTGVSIPGVPASSVLTTDGAANLTYQAIPPVTPAPAFIPGSYYPNYALTQQAGSVATVGQMTAYPIVVPTAHTFTNIAAFISTAGVAAAGRVGIYADNGAGAPGNLIYDNGAAVGVWNMNAAGQINAGGGLAITLQPGLYWLVFVVSAATTPPAPLVDASTRASGIFGQSAPAAVAAQNTGYKSTVSTNTGALPAAFGAVTAIAQTPIVYLVA